MVPSTVLVTMWISCGGLQPAPERPVPSRFGLLAGSGGAVISGAFWLRVYYRRLQLLLVTK